MRTRTLGGLFIAAIFIAAACSSTGSGGSSGLTGKVWHLTTITEKVPAFQGVVPTADQANYTIQFGTDGTFNAKADCNQLSGTYTTTSSGGMTIVPGAMTRALCPEGSMSDQYVAALGNAASYAIASGALTITLKDDGTLGFM